MPRALRRAAVLSLLATCACAPSVSLVREPVLQSSQWSQGAQGSAELTASLGQSLGSAQLDALVARALAGSPDLGVATARLAQARAELRLARAEMLPLVTADTGLRAGRQSGLPSFTDAFAALDVAFDPDLSGGLGAGRRAAQARYAAAELDLQAAALTLEAEVARALVQHAALARRIELLDRNTVQAGELLRIVELRHRAGEGTRVDVGLQRLQLRQLQVERERLLEAQARTRHALAVLAGDEAPLFRPPPVALSDFSVPDLSPGQPARLLVRRPDIRSAEYRIRAADGEVDQARAAFLPSLRISAGGIGEAAALGGPIASVVTAGLNLLAPIFNRPRLEAGLDNASARQVESVELYRRALLTSIGEVEDALAAVARSQARHRLLVDIVAEARTTAHLARRQYVEGEADLQWVLDAEQLLVQAEDAQAVAVQERLEAVIDLYRALGGPAQRQG